MTDLLQRIQRRKDSFFQQKLLKQLDIHMKKRTSYPIPYTKVNSRQAVGLNVRAKTECYKNIGEKSLTLG